MLISSMIFSYDLISIKEAIGSAFTLVDCTNTMATEQAAAPSLRHERSRLEILDILLIAGIHAI
jgi:hypothetical protein